MRNMDNNKVVKKQTLADAKKISVLFILPDLSGGGAERTIVDLLEYIDRDRFIPYLGLLSQTGEYLNLVTVADIRTAKLPDWLQYVLALPSTIHSFSLKSLLPRLLRTPASIYQIQALVRAIQPDIVMTSMTGLNILTNFALGQQGSRKVQWIAREGNSFPTNLKSITKNRILKMLIFRIIQNSYSQADKILTVSKGISREVSEVYKINPGKITYIYNPTNLVQIQQAVQSSKYKPEPNLQVSDDRYIVAVGRLYPQKGFEYLIQALYLCHHQYHLRDLKLLILGEGNYRDTLEVQIQTLKLQEYVKLAGFVENPWIYMTAAQAFVLSSLWEGFPHVVVEAMACQTPVIATDCDYGPKEIIEDDQIGLLVPIRSPEKLAGAIHQLISNPDQAARLARNALIRAQDFDAVKITREYEKLFETVCQRSHDLIRL